MFSQLTENSIPQNMKAPQEVALQQGRVELGEDVREEVGQGADGLLRGKGVWGPGQVENILFNPTLQLGKKSL